MEAYVAYVSAGQAAERLYGLPMTWPTHSWENSFEGYRILWILFFPHHPVIPSRGPKNNNFLA